MDTYQYIGKEACKIGSSLVIPGGVHEMAAPIDESWVLVCGPNGEQLGGETDDPLSGFPKRLTVVLGQARTGTSLACDLVHACGWNVVDAPNRKIDDLRRGRNEFPGIGVRMSNPYVASVSVGRNLLEKECEGVKIGYNFAVFMPLFRANIPDLRVLVMMRNVEDQVKSMGAYGITRQVEDSQATFDYFIEHYLESPDYTTLRVDFERLIAKDRGLLGDIKTFLSSTTSVDDLAAIIDPELSQHITNPEDADG